MSARTADVAPRPGSGDIASAATLIATFYGQRAATVQALHERLDRAFARVPETSAAPDKWRDSTGETFLRAFDPPAAHDTTVIQLALNAPGSAATAWTATRERLQAILDAAALDGIWGYTLIYHAVLAPDVAPDEALSRLLPAVRGLHAAKAMKPLAQADMAGGRVWLLDIAVDGNGLEAATIYVALSPPQGERALLETLYGPGAALLMPDLIAHKGYHQIRQYRLGDLMVRYEQHVRSVQESADRLLDDLGQQAANADDLDRLARDYDALTRVLPRMTTLRISLLRQMHNYDWWRREMAANAIIEYHRSHLETGIIELDLLVAQVHEVLEVARTAVTMAQVQTDKARERQQGQLQLLLAVVGVVLAVPSLLGRDVTSAFLRLMGVAMPREGYNALWLLGLQVGLIVVLALLAVGVVTLLNRRQRPR